MTAPTCGCPVNAPEADPKLYPCPCGAHCPTHRGKMPYAHTFRTPSFLNSRTGKPMPNTGGWQERHMSALRAPRDVEAGIIGMLEAWARYADTHLARYATGIGNDSVLGDAWMEIGRGIRALLNGETGRLDCGPLDGFIYDTLAVEGYPQ